jgi:hypothetical protein
MVAISAVFLSWIAEGQKLQKNKFIYQIIGAPAVNVQSMVFGNMGEIAQQV